MTTLTRKIWLAWIALLAWPAMAGVDGTVNSEPVTVFGAASLSDALIEIGNSYRTIKGPNGNEIRFSFAASSTLARQIEAGAPAAIFASASGPWMDYLQDKTLIEANSRVSIIGNALVLISPLDSLAEPFQLDNPAAVEALLGPAGRLAMGDPAHVPAGIYARQALQTLGLWGAMQSRMAFANDVRAVLALVERGDAPLGIVYATDAAISDRIRILATFQESSHDPIRYSFALVADQSSPTAVSLIAFMGEPRALNIFRRHGFLIP
jgi:molybdate transport system substrate-binding protein